MISGSNAEAPLANMKVAWLVAGLCVASVAANVIPLRGERKVGDAEFLKRQRLVLDLFVGLGHNVPLPKGSADFDIQANIDKFTEPSIAKRFNAFKKHGFLDKNAIFSMSCPHIHHETVLLFDILYFAKDFDTFYKAATWARENANPAMFYYAYIMALVHRKDTRQFSIPPSYEIFPNFFVPQDTMHEIYDYKMSGKKEGRWEFNNTGYEINRHDGLFGGPISLDNYNPHTEYKVSYFREDAALNNYYSHHKLYPAWLKPEKYNLKNYFKVGERFYYTHQQLLARYTLDRLANGLPYTEVFEYTKPVRVGYNPRIAHINGESMLSRPDNFNFKYAVNKYGMSRAQIFEDRLLDSIDYGSLWNQTSENMISLLNDEGVDYIGELIRGNSEIDANGHYYGKWLKSLLLAIALPSPTKNTINLNGGATKYAVTALRDPVFFNVLVRFARLIQRHKAALPVYTEKDLSFPGVSVSNFEVDQLTTYFESFDFEVSNGVAVSEPKDYIDLKYTARQYRLNHKPFNYNITINSDKAQDAMVQLFVGPKYDSEEHLLTLNQKRLNMLEIDVFPVKLTAGQNVIDRNSKDSILFAPDAEGFRAIYERVDHALKTGEPYYIKEEVTCGYPRNLMLPVGWKSGLPYTFAIVVTPYTPRENVNLCGSNKLYNNKPFGFPFDRPIWEDQFDVPNIFFKDENIYLKDEFELNRSS